MSSDLAADIRLEYKPDIFVDRTDEIGALRGIVTAMVAGRPTDTRGIAFVSESGTGKSWLLRHLAEIALTPAQTPLIVGNQLAVPESHSLYVNLSAWGASPEDADARREQVQKLLVSIGRQVAAWAERVPTGILGASTDVPLEELSRWLEADVRQLVSQQVLVLLLDQVYESSWSLLELLDRYLLGPLAAIPRVLIVLTGRGRRYAWKSPELRLSIKEKHLGPFDLEQTREQIGRQTPESPYSAELVRDLSGGYPRSNYAIAKLGPDQGLEAIVQRLLEPIPEDRRETVRGYLEALCVLPAFDDERIPPLLAAYRQESHDEVSPEPDATQVRKALTEPGFAVWKAAAGGWVLDDAIKIAVENCMRGRREKSELFAKLQGRAYRLFQEWGKQFPAAAEIWRAEAEFPFKASYRSVRATPDLVGREAQLGQIETAIQDRGHSYVIQVIGEGGMGKTCLISEVLRRYQEMQGFVVAQMPVDLYHIATHSVDGLMATIQEVLAPKGIGFSSYLKAREDLDHYLAEPTGEAKTLGELRDAVQKAFLDDFHQLSRSARVILALDTAESLRYSIGPVERRLELTQKSIDVWGWLRSVFLPVIQETVIMIAGRKESAELAGELQQITNLEHRCIGIGEFSSGEALAYFAAIAKSAIKQGDLAIAHRISSLHENELLGIIERVGRRPIMLALLVDYMVVADRPLSTLGELEATDFEKELLRVIQDLGRPADQAIRALAWLRKGADSELLARVANLRISDQGWDVTQAEQMLEGLRGLSFVKVRPIDQKVFLHDEMYRLLEHEILQSTNRQAYKTILECYEKRIETTRTDLAGAYQALTEGDVTGWQDVTRFNEKLQKLLVEDLYYQLRANPRQGFNVYYRYAEEAIWGENLSLDMQLYTELLSFLGTQFDVCSLPRQSADFDAALRWVKRCIADEKYADAQFLVHKIREVGLLPPEDRLAAAELLISEALTQLYSGSMPVEIIEQSLQTAVDTLENLPSTWLRNVVLARAYNNLGYLYRTLGRYWGAIDTYRKAIALWRLVKIETEQANTLNNLAFALSEVGDFGNARRQAQDALELRQKSGARPPIGLSHNALAYIALREAFYVTAENNAERALSLFEAAKDLRGRGLALAALAEAKRRFASEGPCTAKEAEVMLQEAATHAREAINAHAATKEQSRPIEALIESGCVYRDWMKLYRRYHGKSEETVESLAAKSIALLQEARQLAINQKTKFREADALINEAWLHYYLVDYYKSTGQTKREQQERASAEECLRITVGNEEHNGTQSSGLVPMKYRITEHGIPVLKKHLVIVPLLAQMGKAYLLKGQIAFGRFFDADKDPASLRDAILYYTLSLAYDSIISERPFRDKRRGVDRMYERIKQLNAEEMQIVYRTVAATEKKYQLGRSEMRHFLEESFGPEELFVRTENSGSDSVAIS